MIIHTTNIMTAPLILIIWTVDLYLFLACIRLILGRFVTTQANSVYPVLQGVVDPLPCALERWLSAWRGRSVPKWLPWLVVVIAVVLIRQLLILTVLRTH